MAFSNIPKQGLATGIECLHCALNFPTSVIIPGSHTMERLDQALEPAKTKEAAMTGKYEPFKTNTQFDRTAKNVHWMG